MKQSLPEILCPHGWRKFELAQKNMMRFIRARRCRHNPRRVNKWAPEMSKWIERIYRHGDPWFGN